VCARLTLLAGADRYAEYLSRPDTQALLRSDADKKHRGRVFRVITNLQKICNHPDLLTLVGSGRAVKERASAARSDGGQPEQGPMARRGGTIAAAAESEDEDELLVRSPSAGLDGPAPPSDYPCSNSAKMLVLKHVLTLWRQEGHKCLVFCQGTQMLDVLERFVGHGSSDGLGLPFMRMDGATPVAKRQGLIDAFNSAFACGAVREVSRLALR
jgi:SNF2 family DNA or RNA helicase